MKTFLYVLLTFVLCSAAYKLGSSRMANKYRELMYTYQVHIDSAGIVHVYKSGVHLGKTRIPIDSILVKDKE